MTRDDTLAAMVRTLISGDLSVIGSIFDRVNELDMPHIYGKFHTALGELFASMPTKAETLQDQQYTRNVEVTREDITSNQAHTLMDAARQLASTYNWGALLTMPEGSTTQPASEENTVDVDFNAIGGFHESPTIYNSYLGSNRRKYKKFLNNVTRIFWCQLMTLEQWVERTTLAVPDKLRSTMGERQLKSLTDE